MSAAARGWASRIEDLLATAPAWMRELASPELHIGGFTNVRLEHPVLDVSAIASDSEAARAFHFFLAAALVRGAVVARVRCGRGPGGRVLAALARHRTRGLATRIDDENLALMRYFDVYLKRAEEIAAAPGERLVRALEEALAAEPR